MLCPSVILRCSRNNNNQKNSGSLITIVYWIACWHDDVFAFLLFTFYTLASYCGERNVTINKCSGSCGPSGASPMSLGDPSVDPGDLYFSIQAGKEQWTLKTECKCCTGDMVLIKRKISCDDGSMETFSVPTATNCECRDCDPGTKGSPVWEVCLKISRVLFHEILKRMRVR